MITPPPKVKPIRLTIPVSPEVHDAFTRIGKAGSMSTGRAMGEWLSDTLEAAAYLADTMEKARAAPRQVAQQLHAYALGLSDETGALLDQIRKGSKAAGEEAAKRPADGGLDPFTPRPSNTGGKVPKNTKQPKRGIS